MISYFSSLSLIFNNIEKSIFLKKINVFNLNCCINEVSYFDLLSFKSIPNYNNSAMDGYALILNKIKYNFDNICSCFFVIDLVKAGDSTSSFNFDGDYVVEIMTGARIPSFFDTVVKIEDVVLDLYNPFEIILKKKLFFGENVRILGDDFRIGNFIIKKGDIFLLKDYASTATFGLKNSFFLDKLNIYLICTGNEVIDSFECDFNRNFVNNSLNTFFLSFLKKFSINILYYGVNLDVKIDLKTKILNLINKAEFNLIITTGAVSKGKADIIPSILSELNIDIIFHGILIKPCKPILFANYLNKNYFFCLPGNPISSIIGIRFFVYPFLRYIMGSSLEKPLKAFLDEDYVLIRKVDLFLKSFVYFSKNNFYVKIMQDQHSFKIKSFIEANSFIFLRVSDKSKKGDILNVYFYESF
ncbi:MAG TPA: molybdopterin-binding protein [Candidatus Azoamicus sp.]